MLAMLERIRLLIIDDWGPEPLAAEQRRDLLEIVDDRYEKGSSQLILTFPRRAFSCSLSTRRKRYSKSPSSSTG